MSSLLDDLPPPPYTPHDPHAADPLLTRPQLPENNVASFNAFIPSPTIPYSGGPISRRPVGQPPNPPSFRSTGRDDLSDCGFVSALPYFELRPFNGQRLSETAVHNLQITVSTHPDSLVFPHPRYLWLRREVDDQDWMTFINHLFPDRAAHEVAPLQELDRLQLSERENEKRQPCGRGASTRYRAASGSSMTGAAHESIRRRKVRVDAVCSEWNAGFFEPRGLRINLMFPDDIFPSSDAVIRPGNVSPSSERLCLTQTRSGCSPAVLRKPQPKTEAEESLLLQAVAKGKKSNVKKLLEDGGEDLEALGKKGETALFRAVSKGDDKIAQMLIEKGADPIARPLGANTPLYTAVCEGRKGMVKILLAAADPGLEVLSDKGESPLYRAVRLDSKAMTELLLDAGANPLSKPWDQESMLNRAITHGTMPVIKMLLSRKVDLEEPNKDGDPPLCRCVAKGDASLCKLLLECGADPAARNSKGQVALSIAATRGDSAIIIALLSQKGLDLEVKNGKGETPLCSCILRDDTTNCNQLLVKGANPNAYPTPSGETMLNIAVSRSNSSLIHLLLSHGAAVNEKSNAGDPPLYCAVSRGETSIVALLLGKKADPCVTGANGDPCLYRAVYRGEASIVSLLLSQKADPDCRSASGEACLYRAVSKGDAAITSLLLSGGGNPHLRHTNGETPLYKAICKGDTSCVSILLSNGAWSGDEVIGGGETAMQTAVRKGNTAIVQLLGCYVPQSDSCGKSLGKGRDLLGL